MRIKQRQPPRGFQVGNAKDIELKDCGTIQLDADEQITFVTEAGGEYDVARKDWGFYATPSLNGRLANFGLRPVIVKNALGKYYLLLVEHGKERLFEAYIGSEGQTIVRWVDTDEACRALEGVGR